MIKTNKIASWNCPEKKFECQPSQFSKMLDTDGAIEGFIVSEALADTSAASKSLSTTPLLFPLQASSVYTAQERWTRVR